MLTKEQLEQIRERRIGDNPPPEFPGGDITQLLEHIEEQDAIIDRLRSVERKHHKLLLEYIKIIRPSGNVYHAGGSPLIVGIMRELAEAGLMRIVCEGSDNICAARLTPAGAEMMEGE